MAKFDTSAGRLARFSTVGAVLLAISAPLPVLSQTLEEVVVTARKREVNLQEAAIALSVVSGDDFDKSNIVRLDNFNGYAPGLTVAKNDGAGRVVTHPWCRLGDGAKPRFATQRADVYRRHLSGQSDCHGPGPRRVGTC